MDLIQSTLSSTVAKPFLWSRSKIASRLHGALAIARTGASQQQCANEVVVPRTDWSAAKGQQLRVRSCLLFSKQLYDPFQVLLSIWRRKSRSRLDESNYLRCQGAIDQMR